MTAYYHKNSPAFKHDCEDCKLIKSISNDEGFKIDLYKSCNKSYMDFIIRYSSEPSDYTTLNIETMAIHYAELMTGNLPKVFRNKDKR